MTAPLHTYAEYLGLEASSNVKHEFLGGQIYAMAGGTPEHAALAAAVTGLLFGQLRGGDWRRAVVREGDLAIGARLDVRALYDAAAEPAA
jgi:hypothetical protein